MSYLGNRVTGRELDKDHAFDLLESLYFSLEASVLLSAVNSAHGVGWRKERLQIGPWGILIPWPSFNGSALRQLPQPT
jgi:hypothetical protein